ncbi:hypothetical protein LCER1_G006265 [Lachnellula cervina]|uniref:Uncharacterized protein n=1 Tax=Lachnellula cervina TaxID=1316786 RepID=A0A7D8UL04_9HELO|nr:hypothetical protein LCER1_G006265 [Lachnellula cervina]
MKIFHQPLLVAFALFSFALPSLGAADCPTGLSLCSPPGATNLDIPQIGSPEFESLYTDLLHSPLPPPKRSRADEGTASLCCITSLSCLAMPTLALPFCYDKFTTNFYLPDTSFGTLSLGTYTSCLGDFSDLKTGDYTLKNGTKGNIYSDNPSAKPDTSTLVLPTQFTSSGVGPAIPASALGGAMTWSTLSATTIPPSTRSESVGTQTFLYPETVSITVSGTPQQSEVAVTSFELSTSSATTIEGTTVKATTLPEAVTTATATTTTKVGTSSSGVGVTASASSKKSTAMRFSVESLSISSMLALALVFLIDC